ncbi:hypothetical protein LY10_03207 [Planktotalea frisia]|uniref:Uncharacterized protein n=1 Tax=Planktotalea frisia TaxID=696762 RepID=A0A1L9NSE5_9RHOB|nr:hypothetical protein PFRI_35620 [Planktotalea frisia]PZX23124.1 hypothetical protein LY10_03207 [Planktotalea frisia]
MQTANGACFGANRVIILNEIKRQTNLFKAPLGIALAEEATFIPEALGNNSQHIQYFCSINFHTHTFTLLIFTRKH